MDYRLVFHDGEGRFMLSLEIQAPCDADALSQARLLEGTCWVEVWQRVRRVGVVEPSARHYPSIPNLR